ncbi:MAG: GTP cyclohydrolase I FolE2 [Candidatus Riflebacteria bacterium]|nr:GTP cyclohydrolase I FolE2 [Candidatus Riflebacteria bacterium]
MEDIQCQKDERNISIDRVGVKGLSYPVSLLDRSSGTQNSIGQIEMYVDLPRDFRATHMSRFIEVMHDYRDEITFPHMKGLLKTIKRKLAAERAEMKVDFPYFVEKCAPVSKVRSLMRYDCSFHGILDTVMDFIISVKVPVTSLCPCSKAISKYSAHNQRSIISISVRFKKFIWLEELIEIAEQSSSSDIFTLLKRPDEKFLTEKAYERPRFAEDLVREAALRLDKHKEILWYTVSSENIESIHAHSAYAFLKKDKRVIKNPNLSE